MQNETPLRHINFTCSKDLRQYYLCTVILQRRHGETFTGNLFCIPAKNSSDFEQQNIELDHAEVRK